MKYKLMSYLLTVFLLVAHVFSQSSLSGTFSQSTQTPISSNIVGSGSQYFQISWNVIGSLSACTIKVDSSADGITWNNGDIIAGQTCTSGGNFTSTAHTVNYIRINPNSTITGTGVLAVVLFGFVNNPAGGGGSFPVTGPQQVSSGGSIVPSSTGQLASTSFWNQIVNGNAYPPVPTATINNLGGSLTQNTYYIRITYVGLSVTVPSPELKEVLDSNSCASNSTCQIVINMPTSCQTGSLPTGATGCTVWDNTAVFNTEKQQTLNNNCVNIATTTCTINALATGSTITFPSSSGITPGSLTAITQPDGIVPINYQQIGDTSYTPCGGTDTTALGGITGAPSSTQVLPVTGGTPGTFTWTCRFFVNDTASPPLQSNVLFSVHHLTGQTTGGGTVASSALNPDDRAFGIEDVDGGCTNCNFGQTLAQYNERLVQSNNVTSGATGGGAAWGEDFSASGRFNITDSRSAPTSNLNVPTIVGIHGVAYSTTSTTTNYSSCGGAVGLPCAVGVVGGAAMLTNNQNGNNFSWWGGLFGANSISGNTSANGGGIYIEAPSVRFASNNIGEYIQDFGSNASDYNFISGATNENQGKYLIRGTMYANYIASMNLNTTFRFTTPTCSFVSGGGTSPTCATRAGSSGSLGRIVLTTGTGSPAGTGTVTLTFNTAWASPVTDVSCVATAEDNGGVWNGLIVIKVTSHSTSAITFTWTNGTTPTTLTASTTYDINYNCWGN